MNSKLSSILFHVGNVVLFLTGVAHTIGHFSGKPEPVNDQQRQFLELLPKTMFEMPSGEQRSYDDIHHAFSLYFSVFPIFVALILWSVSKDGNGFRRALIIAAVMMLALAIITYKFAILPPLVMMAITAICFAGAAVTAKKS